MDNLKVKMIKPIQKESVMKEYLEPMPNGDYRYHKDDGFSIGGDWIEIPEGAIRATYCNEFLIFWKDGFFSLSRKNGDTYFTFNPIEDYGFDEYMHLNEDAVVVWQRESLNDQVASAEEYRQAEVLPFIDDEPKSAWDTQVGGDHYKKLAIQPMQYSLANGLDAGQHTVIKYVTRFKDKNGKEDLIKARQSIDLLIAHYYGDEE